MSYDWGQIKCSYAYERAQFSFFKLSSLTIFCIHAILLPFSFFFPFVTLFLPPFDLFPSSRFLPLSLIFLFVSYFNKLSMRAWHRWKEIYDVKFIIHAQTNKCTITMLFSCIYFVFQSLHLHVSVTPVTIFRVSYNKNTRGAIDLHKMHDKIFVHRFEWVSNCQSITKSFKNFLHLW